MVRSSHSGWYPKFLTDGDHHYQSILSLSRKNPPLGPPSGNVASQTAMSAPSSTDLGAFRPPMSVLTQPGHIAFTSTFVPLNSVASITVNALRLVLDRL